MTQNNLKFYDPQKRPWPNPRLDRGSIIGHTTASSVRLWFRVSEAGRYWLVVSRDPIPTQGMPDVVRENNREECRVTSSRGQVPGTQPSETGDGRAIATATESPIPLQIDRDRDLTVVVDIEDLQSDTRYYYALFQPNREIPWELGHEEPLSFRTFPEQATAVNFGIYSCHMPYEGHKIAQMEMWDAFYRELCAADARFILATGDQVYVDGEKELSIWEWLRQNRHRNPDRAQMVDWYRDIYRGYWGFSALQKVYRCFPTYMIWDDHDIVDGWGSYTPKELAGLLDRSWELRNLNEQLRLAGEMFEAAKQVYEEYQHSHNPPTDSEANQFDYSLNYGRYAFYILDMRGHHNYNRAELRSLGVEQWMRFEAWLNQQYNDPPRILFIISPVPVVHFNSFAINEIDLSLLGYQDDQRDHWEHRSNWDERNKLLSLVFRWSQQTQGKVIFISGDVHIGAAFKISHPDSPEARVFQLTSSGITYADLSPFARRVLEFGVQKDGVLGDRKGNVPYRVRNLALCRHYNFGIVRLADKDNGDVGVIYDLFGGKHDRHGTFEVYKTRLDLDAIS